LTLATTLTVIIVIVNLFQIPPPGRDREYQERAIILKLTANVLARDGEDAAARFIRTSEETVPLGLTLSKSTESPACEDEGRAETKSILKDGICYRISVAPEANFLLNVVDNLALLVPWLSIFVSSTFAAAALARYLIRPVVHLRDGLSALAHGRFDFRIGDQMAGRKDEVTALAHDFDSTAARLRSFRMRSSGCSMMSPMNCVRPCPACRPPSACFGRARPNSAPCWTGWTGRSNGSTRWSARF